jgi:hypothetical protein
MTTIPAEPQAPITEHACDLLPNTCPAIMRGGPGVEDAEDPHRGLVGPKRQEDLPGAKLDSVVVRPLVTPLGVTRYTRRLVSSRARDVDQRSPRQSRHSG